MSLKTDLHSLASQFGPGQHSHFKHEEIDAMSGVDETRSCHCRMWGDIF
jgi:hypothetical protein